MNLRSRDYEAVLELVGEIHDVESTAELRSLLLPTLRQMTPAEYSSYNEVHADGRPPEFVVDPPIPERLAPAWERLGHTNPLLVRYQRTRDGRPYRFSDVLPEHELRVLPLFREFYLPLGVEHQIAFTLPAPRELTIAVVLSRAGADFSDRERDMLNLVRPHIIQAYRNAQFRDQSDKLIKAMREGLSLAGLAILVTDGNGRVEFVTDSAKSAADECGLDAPVTGAALPAWLRTLLPPDAHAAMLSVGHNTLLARRATGSDVETIVLEQARRVLSPETLGALGLTPRESEVLAEVAAGHGASEVAAALGIEPRTVQKHLQRVYAKLGVRDRGQAIATAWAAAGTTASLGG